MVILAATLLTGCVFRVVYNQLDWLIFWYVDGYFDLTESQEPLARDIIRRDLAWHKATQLPRYADFVQVVLENADGPLTQQFVAQRYEEIVTLWDEFLRHVAPDAALVLQTLTDDQVEEFFEELADENADLANDFSGETREVRRAKQDRAIVRAFRRLTGPLTDQQQALIRSETAGMHDLSSQWLARREAWQAALRVLLGKHRRDADFGGQFSDLVLNPNQFDSPGYRDLVIENHEIAFGLVADVVTSLAPKQNKHLRGKLEDYVSDMRTLIPGPGK